MTTTTILVAPSVWRSGIPGPDAFIITPVSGKLRFRLHGDSWELNLGICKGDRLWIYPPQGKIFMSRIAGQAELRFDKGTWNTNFVLDKWNTIEFKGTSFEGPGAAPTECPECFGTGLKGGFQAPCSRGCTS